MSKKISPPVHPGEILLEEFIKPLKLSQYRLAKDINVPPRRINEIILGKRAISADTALRLSRYFRMSRQFWINLQTDYDLEVAEEKLGKKLLLDIKVNYGNVFNAKRDNKNKGINAKDLLAAL